MKRHKIAYFTLIELLAAMAVFSILLVISMRLFSGAQQIWLRSEQKTDTFASARTAMEFVSSRLQTISYVSDEPFEMKEGTPDGGHASGYECDTIWFISNMATGDRGHYRHFIKFRLVDPTDKNHDSAGILQMLRFSGGVNGKNFWQLFPPYSSKRVRGKTVYSPSDARKEVNKVFKDMEEDDEPEVSGGQAVVDIAENVVSFKLERYIAETETSNKLEKKSGDVKMAPYLIEVEVKMLDNHESFKAWQNAETQSERDNVFIEHGYTFRRAILLGKRGYE